MSDQAWSSIEVEVAEALRAGQVLDLIGRADRTVRAEVIRDLLTGRPAHGFDRVEPDPRGLLLFGATLLGRLDLDNVRSTVPLALLSCTLDGGASLRFAHLPHLALTGSSLTPANAATDASVLDADELIVDHDLHLDRIKITTRSSLPVVNLPGASIGGLLNLSKAELTNTSGPALHADGLTVNSSAFLDEMRVEASSELGAVRLRGAHIGGQLDLAGAELINSQGPALDGDNLTVDSGAFLEVKAAGGGELGAVRLLGARIGGQLNLAGAELINSGGPALAADRLIVNGGGFLVEMKAVGSGELGAVRLVGAHIGGQLNLSRAELTSTSGPALHADGLTVDGTGSLEGMSAAAGDGGGSAVRLLGARIGAQLNLSRAKLTSTSGPALSADGLTVDSFAVFDELKAEGGGELGAVRLLGARIGGPLSLTKAELTSTGGPALDADTSIIDSDAFLMRLKAEGGGELGAVRLVGAHIGGQLNLSRAELTSSSGPALHADNLTVDSSALLGIAKARSGPRQPTVRLFGAHIGGQLVGDFTTMTSGTDSGQLVIDGLTYRGLPNAGVDRWLHLLRHATPDYGAQPYRYLAAAATAQGHDADTRKILIAQRRDQLHRPGTTLRRRDRAWGRFTWWTLGYGYQPWRALIGLILVALAAAALTVAYGTWGLYPKDHQYDGTRCTLTDRAVIGIDNALPLISTTTATTCLLRPAPNHSAQVLTWTGIGAQTGGWAFATLFVAGFTSAVRKT